MTIKFKQLVEGIKPQQKQETQQIDEQIEIVEEEETVEVQPEAKTYSTFTQWLSEACSKKMKEKVEVHDGDEDGKRLGEESELDEEEKSIKAVDVKTALKNVKNASSHTKKMIKANPTQKMPHGSSRHAAYSEEFELDEGIKSMVHSYLAKRAGKKADDAYDMGDEKEFQKQVDKSEYHRVKAGGKPTRINKNPDAKFLTTREEFELDESVKIIDRDSDLDQEHFKLSVNGKPVHFVHHNYEGGHATDSKQDIHYQVKNQLKHLSDADKKKVTDTVHASYRMKEEFELDEGQTIKTKTGVIHKGSYGSEYETDEEGNEKKKEAPAVKRGRGRPKKGSDESGNVKKYTFHDLLNKLSR